MLRRHCCRAARFLTRTRGDATDRGVAALQTAIVATVLLFMIFGIIQTALYMHARNVVTTAANIGVEGARGSGDSAGRGQAAAMALINASTPKLVTGTSVSVNRSATTVTVVVTSHCKSVIPGISYPQIRAQAKGPVERVTR